MMVKRLRSTRRTRAAPSRRTCRAATTGRRKSSYATTTASHGGGRATDLRRRTRSWRCRRQAPTRGTASVKVTAVAAFVAVGVIIRWEVRVVVVVVVMMVVLRLMSKSKGRSPAARGMLDSEPDGGLRQVGRTTTATSSCTSYGRHGAHAARSRDVAVVVVRTSSSTSGPWEGSERGSLSMMLGERGRGCLRAVGTAPCAVCSSSSVVSMIRRGRREALTRSRRRSASCSPFARNNRVNTATAVIVVIIGVRFPTRRGAGR